MLTHKTPLAKLAVAGTLAFSAVGLSACGDDTTGPEEGVSVGDIQEEDAGAAEPDAADPDAADPDAADPGLAPYDGLYDQTFYDDIESYEGQQVTVSADVNEILSMASFTIAGTTETSVEPLLIVGADDTSVLDPGQTVAVSGTVQQAFDIVTVEEDLGVDLDDAAFEAYETQPYIVADSVDTEVPVENE